MKYSSIASSVASIIVIDPMHVPLGIVMVPPDSFIAITWYSFVFVASWIDGIMLRPGVSWISFWLLPIIVFIVIDSFGRIVISV